MELRVNSIWCETQISRTVKSLFFDGPWFNSWWNFCWFVGLYKSIRVNDKQKIKCYNSQKYIGFLWILSIALWITQKIYIFIIVRLTISLMKSYFFVFVSFDGNCLSFISPWIFQHYFLLSFFTIHEKMIKIFHLAGL